MAVKKTVRLELSQPRIYGSFEDIEDDRGDRPIKTLSLPFTVWRRVIGLAQVAGFPVTSNPHHLFPAQTRDLAERLRAVLAEKPVAPRRASRQTAKSQLLEFRATSQKW